jgi:hypothetical protein
MLLMRMEEKIKKLCSLPIEKFKKEYTEMYDSANEDEKKEIISLFKKNANDLILYQKLICLLRKQR